MTASEENMEKILLDLATQASQDVATSKETKEEVQQKAQDEEKELVEGVDNTAETGNEESIEEGKTIPSELEDELKNIDPELREAILQASPELRENQIKVFKKMRAGFDKKHTEIGELKKLAESTKDLFRQYGLDERKGLDQIKNLIEFENKLRNDPKTVIKGLQEMFNEKESVVTGSKIEEIDIDSLTDNERVLYNKILQAEEQAKLAKKEAEKLKIQAEQEKQQIILSEINAFKNAVDEEGNLKNPYFEDFIPEMERLSVQFPNDNIEKLYNKAYKKYEEIFSKSIDKKRKENNLPTKKQEEAILKAKSINSQSFKSKMSGDPRDKDPNDYLLELASEYLTKS